VPGHGQPQVLEGGWGVIAVGAQEGDHHQDFTTRVLYGGDTELHRACHDDEAWLVRACIAFNDADDINKPNDAGNTPLHFACIYEAHIDVVKLLLESGAQKSLYHKSNGGYGYIPIVIAFDLEGFDIVKLLLKARIFVLDLKLSKEVGVSQRLQGWRRQRNLRKRNLWEEFYKSGL